MKTDRSQLWEEYEDAAFAILMHTVAEQEGEQALQRLDELDQDPSAQLPEEVQQRAEETIRKTFAVQSRRSARQRGFRILRRIAVAALLIVFMTKCVFAVFPEVRSNVINTIIRVCEEHTGISFADMGEKDYTSAGYQITPHWLPQGFELSEEGNTSLSIWKLYQDDGDGNLYISMTTMEDNSMAVDTEDAVVSQIDINGYDGTLVVKDSADWMCVVFAIPEKRVVMYLDIQPIVEKDVLIQVAENLEIES